MYRSPKETYQESKFFTANPAELVLICYDGAIGNLRAAKAFYAEKDFYSKAKALQKTFDIIHELNASLDMQRGGVIAANLRAIYTYLVRSLIEADLKADFDAFDRTIKILEELASSWREIAKPKEEVKHEPSGMNPQMRQMQVGKPGRSAASAIA